MVNGAVGVAGLPSSCRQCCEEPGLGAKAADRWPVQVAEGQASELGLGAAVPGHGDLGRGMLQGGLVCCQGGGGAGGASTQQPVCLLPPCIGLVLAHPPTTDRCSASPCLAGPRGVTVLGVWADPCLSPVL